MDYAELEDSQGTLLKLQNEFDHATDRVDADERIWSNTALKNAMHSFAYDWNNHRKNLLDKMDKTHDLTTHCLDSMRKADKDLADGLNVNQSK